MDRLFNMLGEEYYLDLDRISNFSKMEPTIDEILERREIEGVSVIPEWSMFNIFPIIMVVK